MTEENVDIEFRALYALDEIDVIFGLDHSKAAEQVKSLQSGNVKFALTDPVKKCSDCVMTLSGSLESVIDTIEEIAEITAKAQADEKLRDPSTYSYKYLQPYLPEPKLEDFVGCESLADIVTLRCLLKNYSLSKVIGKGGKTVKSLSADKKVKIIASRNYLPDSEERLLLVQGSSKNVGSTIREVVELILREPDITKPPRQRIYTPHLTRTLRIANASEDQDETFTKHVQVPEIYVGAIIGRARTRLASLKRYTRTTISVSEKDESGSGDNETKPLPGHRLFTVSGRNESNVNTAASMLESNVETERKRREKGGTEINAIKRNEMATASAA